MSDKISIFWNPWHGCTKISLGCQNCYVYRIDKRYGRDPKECRITGSFNLPIRKVGRKKFEKTYLIPSGSTIMTCFTSDFLLEDADEYRGLAWDYIRSRSDCKFLFITKRIDRFMNCIPSDWNNGWDNVHIICTIENQDMADYRLPIFSSLPIKHKSLCLEPLLEYVDLSRYMDKLNLESVIVGGESGPGSRECRYDWIIMIKGLIDSYKIPFWFKQTGAKFIDENGILRRISRKDQFIEADKFELSTFSLI